MKLRITLFDCCAEKKARNRNILCMVIIGIIPAVLAGCPDEPPTTRSSDTVGADIRVLYFGGAGGDRPNNFFRCATGGQAIDTLVNGLDNGQRRAVFNEETKRCEMCTWNSITQSYSDDCESIENISIKRAGNGRTIHSKLFLYDGALTRLYHTGSSTSGVTAAANFLKDNPATNQVNIVVAHSWGYECSRAYMRQIRDKFKAVDYYFIIDGIGSHPISQCSPGRLRIYDIDYGHAWNFYISGGLVSIERLDGIPNERNIRVNDWCSKSGSNVNCHGRIDSKFGDVAVQYFITTCLNRPEGAARDACLFDKIRCLGQPIAEPGGVGADVRVLYFGGTGDEPTNFFSRTNQKIHTIDCGKNGEVIYNGEVSDRRTIQSSLYLINQAGVHEYEANSTDTGVNAAASFLRENQKDNQVKIVVAHGNGYACSRAYMTQIRNELRQPVDYYFIIDGVAGNTGVAGSYGCSFPGSILSTTADYGQVWNFHVSGDSLVSVDDIPANNMNINVNQWCRNNDYRTDGSIADDMHCRNKIDDELGDVVVEYFIKTCLNRTGGTERDNCLFKELVDRGVIPPPQSVTISNIHAASQSFSFEVANPNPNPVQVTVAFTSPPPAKARVVDGNVSMSVASARIDLTNTGTDGARKNIQITGLTNEVEYTVTLTTADRHGNSQRQTVQARATPKFSPEFFYPHANGVTIVCTHAADGDTGVVNGVTYTKRTQEQITVENAARSCTSGITDMSELFRNKASFDADIRHWDTSSVTNMRNMFNGARNFNQHIGSWDVSKVTDMRSMFNGASSFNQNLSGWRPLCISSKPSSFDTNTATGFVGVANRQPMWNTSPPSSCSSNDDHGDTQAKATRVTARSTASGRIEVGNDVDYFRITTTGAGTIRAYTTGSLDTLGAIYASGSRSSLASDDDSGSGKNFDVSYRVNRAGTYYIRVKSFFSRTGLYTLHVSFTP